jgi:uncharacterized protein YcgI (DUF1989 family)
VSSVLTLTIPGGHGAAFAAAAGSLIDIVDIEGQQALDFVAFCSEDLGETLSGVETRRALRSLYIRNGDQLYSSRGRPMFRIVQDSIGVHDYTIPACDYSRFAVDFGCPGHRNCLHNMFEPLKVHGVKSELDVPEPFNFFQNSPVVEDGRTAVVDPPSKPGDLITLKALVNVICAVSSCPQDIIPGNGLRPSPLGITVRTEAA